MISIDLNLFFASTFKLRRESICCEFSVAATASSAITLFSIFNGIISLLNEIIVIIITLLIESTTVIIFRIRDHATFFRSRFFNNNRGAVWR